MTVSFTKQQRDRAKAEGKALIAIAIDGRTARKPSGKIEFWGPATEEEAAKLEAVMLEIMRGRKKACRSTPTT